MNGNAEGPQLRFASSVESRDGAAIAIVALDGELDLGMLEVLEEAIGQQPDGQAGLVLDLSDLSFIDSAGIHALVAAREGLEQSGIPSALVVAPGSNVERILDMTGLLERLASHPDRDSAMAAVASAPDD
jgi:anti-sigma B factor antagonist